MRIALLGYGKMGRTIEKIATDRGHNVELRIDSYNQELFTVENLKGLDVAIEFSRPDKAVANISRCFEAGVPVVCGTTGWYEHLPHIEALCQEHHSALFWDSNFSIGVNLFFAMNREIARLMNGRTDYAASLTEIHHTQKLDAPSGTAITTAEILLKGMEQYSGWTLLPEEEIGKIPIDALRIEDVPGTHTVNFKSDIDEITLTHKAFNRSGFALGAVMAAEFLQGKTGIYRMHQLLKLW